MKEYGYKNLKNKIVRFLRKAVRKQINEYDCNDHWDCGDRDDLELDESFSPLIGEDCGMCQNQIGRAHV